MIATRPGSGGASDRLLVMGLLKGAWLAEACYTVAKLGIPDLMAVEPKAVEQIAADAAVDPDALYRVLRALSTVDIVTEVPGRSFALTEAGVLLRADTPASLLPIVLIIGDEVLGLFGDLSHTVRTGQPAFEHVNGLPFYDYLEANPDRNRAMTAGLAASRHVPSVLSWCDFTGVSSIADLGGGNGALLAYVLKAHPDVHGILLELPEAARQARTLLAEEGVADRCDVIEGDFFDSVPQADMYVLARVLRNWEDDRVLALLGRIRQACHTGSRLLLFEKVIPDEPVFHPAKIDDLMMLVLVRGRDRTESEHRKLLSAAGFEVRELGRAVAELDAEAVVEAVAR